MEKNIGKLPIVSKQHRKKTEPDLAKNGSARNGGSASEQNSDGFLKRAGKHPFVTAGIVIAGAGIAYAIGKAAQSAADPVAREAHLETSILINRSPQELFEFWRDFQNLPLFMKNLESVTVIDSKKSHWV
ncbi:MAG TPA: SRPBCC family protein, partial [Anaerolineales bacterium]|nr:SRPBCC family protein [Anaerolineales bacterium]